MADFIPVHELAEYLGTGQINIDTHAFKAVITNTAPNQATNAILGNLTEIGTTGGYADADLTGVAWTEVSAGVWEFDCNAFSWQANGANFAEGQYIYIYDSESTSAVNALIGYLNYGSPFIVTDGNTLTVTPGANGVWRLTVS
jgi:hypothetical protein